MSYPVRTIGGLEGPLNLPWPTIPPGWVPPGTLIPDGKGGSMPAPFPGPPPGDAPETTDGGTLTLVALGGVAAGAVGLWLYFRFVR